MNLREYQQLKDRVDRLQSDSDRAEGSLAQLAVQLEKEFGAASVKEAGGLLARLTKEAEEAERKFAKALREFEDKWESKLKGES